MCLDVLRAFGRSPDAREVVLEELSDARGRHPDYDAVFERFASDTAAGTAEAHARRFTQSFVTLMQAKLLLAGAAGAASAALPARRRCRPIRHPTSQSFSNRLG